MIEVAKDTLEIIRLGNYTNGDGRQVEVAREVRRCIAETTYHAPDSLAE